MEEKKVKDLSANYIKLQRQNEKNKAIIVILVFAMVLMLTLIAIYFLNGKSQEEKKEDNTQGTSTVKVNVEEVMEELRYQYGNPIMFTMPIKHNDIGMIVSYNSSELTTEDKSGIIWSYVTRYRSKYCDDETYFCFIKVSELNEKVGLEINNNFAATDYVAGIVKLEDGIDYYKVYSPAIGLDVLHTPENCGVSNDGNKINVKCDIVENDMGEGTVKTIGKGVYTYDITNGLKFEKFTYTGIGD